MSAHPLVQPLVSPSTSEPTEPAAYIRPSDHSASSSSLRNGKIAFGNAKNIAAMSIAYVPSSTGRLQAYRAPSAMPRSDGFCPFSTGGAGASRRHRNTETVNVTTVTV